MAEKVSSIGTLRDSINTIPTHTFVGLGTVKTEGSEDSLVADSHRHTGRMSWNQSRAQTASLAPG